LIGIIVSTLGLSGALVAYPAGAKPGSRHDAQKLAKALKKCREDKSRSKRKKCESTAKANYLLSTPRTTSPSTGTRTTGAGTAGPSTPAPTTTTTGPGTPPEAPSPHVPACIEALYLRLKPGTVGEPFSISEAVGCLPEGRYRQAVIIWGDGTRSPGTITATSTGRSPASVTVAGEHVYAAPGDYSIEISVVEETTDRTYTGGRHTVAGIAPATGAALNVGHGR
jgi:hypothetical protein